MPFSLKNIIVLFLFISFAKVTAQEYVFSGVVKSSDNKDELIGANIIINSTEGVVTDEKGKFNIKLKKGMYEVAISYLGYEAILDTITLVKNEYRSYELAESSILSEDVVIKSAANNISTDLMPGMLTISSKSIKNLPALFGEPDIINSIKMTPGVQAAGDGNAGFYVRGGGVDQNAILLDKSTIYNPTHVLGFISVFNADILEYTTFVKSGMPAQYGGRLSSVVDIKTTSGNKSDFNHKVQTGVISSKIFSQGPVVKNKISYVCSFRRSYIDELLKPAAKKVIPELESLFLESKYYFTDLYAKLNYSINTKNNLSVSTYYGIDEFSLDRINYEFKNSFDWGNNVYAINWAHSVSGKTYYNLSGHLTTYNFNFDASRQGVQINLMSGINEYGLQYNLIHKSNKVAELNSGFDFKFRKFIPNNVDAEVNESDFYFGTNTIYNSSETALFSNCIVNIGALWQVSVGLRYTNYIHLGPYTEYINQSDSIVYLPGDIVKQYNRIEPRLSLKYSVNLRSSFKFSYTINNQFIHLAPSSTVTLPVDVWLTSSKSIKPQNANQFSAGYFFDNKTNLQWYVDMYYKVLENQIEMTAGIIDNFKNNNINNNLVVGSGEAFGIECFIQKTTKKASFTSSLALSRNLRKFDSIQDGRIYPAKFDRLIDAKCNYVHYINNRMSASAVFIFATGNAMTLPGGWALINENLIAVPGDKNNFRLPAYHRLDISFTYNLKVKKDRKSELIFSVFNVYNRANPFYIYFDIEGDVSSRLSIKPKQVSLFPILPSIAWNYVF